MRPLRIGLVGAGIIGGTHSAVLQTIARMMPEQIELTAIADRSGQARDTFQSLFSWQTAYVDHTALLREAAVDAVFVCTPTVFHAEIVAAAARAGAHVFVEKPLAMSHAEAQDMAATVRRAGVKAQVGLVLRFSAVYAVMRDLLAAPGTGEPIAAVFRDDQVFPIRGLHDSAWRKDRRMTAGGTLVEHSVHDLDLLGWFFGPPLRLRAWQRNRAGHPGIEDYVAVELEFSGGLRAQLVSVWHDMLQRRSNRRLEIFCQRGFVASDHDMVGDVLVQHGDGEERRLGAHDVLDRFATLIGRPDTRFRDWYGVPYLLQDLAFIEALRADRDPAPGLEIGIEAQRIAEAVYRAAASGDEVQVQVPPP